MCVGGPRLMLGIVLKCFLTWLLTKLNLLTKLKVFITTLLWDPLALPAGPPWHFCEFWGSERWSSHLHAKYFNHWAISYQLEACDFLTGFYEYSTTDIYQACSRPGLIKRCWETEKSKASNNIDLHCITDRGRDRCCFAPAWLCYCFRTYVWVHICVIMNNYH